MGICFNKECKALRILANVKIIMQATTIEELKKEKDEALKINAQLREELKNLNLRRQGPLYMTLNQTYPP